MNFINETNNYEECYDNCNLKINEFDLNDCLNNQVNNNFNTQNNYNDFNNQTYNNFNTQNNYNDYNTLNETPVYNTSDRLNCTKDIDFDFSLETRINGNYIDDNIVNSYDYKQNINEVYINNNQNKKENTRNVSEDYDVVDVAIFEAIGRQTFHGIIKPILQKLR